MLQLYRYGKYAGLDPNVQTSESASSEQAVESTEDTINAQIADLNEERDDLRQELLEVETEIAYQEKLKKQAASNDPMWNMAVEKYLRTGDLAGVSSILQRAATVSENKLNREANEKIAREAKEQTKAEQNEANARSARFSRNVLSELLKTYNAVKGDPNKQVEAGNDLIKQLQDVKEKAEIAGMTMEDLYSEMPEELEAVNLAIDEARLTAKSNIEKDKQNNAKARAAQNVRNAVSNAIAEFNKASKDYKTATKKKKDLEKDYPGFIFSLVKGKSGGWAIDYKEKAK